MWDRWAGARRRVHEKEPVMSSHQVEEAPAEARRKEIFLALVEAQDRLVVAQDQGSGVARSRRLIAERFSVPESLVRAIEEEGLDHEWPPL
jgi:hypothetical protein